MNTRKELKKLFKESDSPLEKEVLRDLLNEDNPEQYLNDLLQHGAVSGMVSGLIYYTDTKKFYIKHMEEIDEILADIEEEIGDPLKKTSPIYNWMAWLGYEETARKIQEKLETGKEGEGNE